MRYAIYKNVRNASWKVLIYCHVHKIPIDVISICNMYNVKVIDNTSVKLLKSGESGRIFRVNGKIYIIVNDNQSIQRQRFSIMHELGHYLLGHLGDTPLSRDYDSIRPEEEQAADKFAADVLMPACVLWALNIHTAEEIVDLCNVSMQAAQIRAQRMDELYKRNMFLSHPLERQVFWQFKPFLNK